METEKTKIVGVTYDGRQENIKKINDMVDQLVAEREPENPYDPNAIHIYIVPDSTIYVDDNVDYTPEELVSCGYINRHLAKELAPEMDAGKELKIHDYHIMGNGIDTPLGVMIEYSLY